MKISMYLPTIFNEFWGNDHNNTILTWLDRNPHIFLKLYLLKTIKTTYTPSL